MTGITAVKTSRDEISDDVVRLLEEALADAKERPCDGVSFVLSFRDGTARTNQRCKDKFGLAGLIELQKINLLRDND